MEEKSKEIHRIKKYADNKLYDTTAEKYISSDELLAWVSAGENVIVEDNETGEDVTASVVAQFLAREEEDEAEREVPSGLLIQLLRKGGDTFISYAKKYTTFCQNAVTMAEDEIDKFINMMVKSKEISETEGNKLKKEVLAYKENFKGWMSDKIDKRVKEVLDMMNLASKDQVSELQAKIESLTETMEKLKKENAEKAE